MTKANGTTSRFIFRGNAMPFGGQLFSVNGEPTRRLLKSPPASALPVSGGRNIGLSGGDSDDQFAWGKTVAESTGETKADGRQVTTVTVSLADFSAKNGDFEFTAGLLAVTLVTEHPVPGASIRVGAAKLQPSTVCREIVFGGDRGMFVDRQQVIVEYDRDLDESVTFSSFEDKFKKNESFFRRYQGRFTGVDGKALTLGNKLPRRPSGYVSTTIVQSVTWGGRKRRGNSLTVKGFGTICFGELLMDEGSRRLTLVRLAMGSNVRASAACGEVDTNGTWGN